MGFWRMQMVPRVVGVSGSHNEGNLNFHAHKDNTIKPDFVYPDPLPDYGSGRYAQYRIKIAGVYIYQGSQCSRYLSKLFNSDIVRSR